MSIELTEDERRILLLHDKDPDLIAATCHQRPDWLDELLECTCGTCEAADRQRRVIHTVDCPTCGTIAGLACEDTDGYRQPKQTHPARIGYVRTVERIYQCLNENYLPAGVQFWLDAMNRNLGMQRPGELIASGRAAEVLAEAERLAGGAW